MRQLMTGYPPSPATQVTLANWRTAPLNKWSFHHVRELIPTVEIANDPPHLMRLTSAIVDLSELTIERPAQSLTFEEFLEQTHTDAIVILRNNEILFERYANGMSEATPHILMSVSKSVLGLLTGILVERGDLDPERPVTDYVSEVADTAYRGATLRHLLDMRAGIDFDEDYLATSGPIVAYRKATNWNPLETGDGAPDLRSFYRELQTRSGPHGGPVNYVSPNNDLLGWVIERATGQRYADLASELLWKPLGAEHPAYITVDRLGAPRCAGGICTTARDLARLGALMARDTVKQRRTIIPDGWIEDLAKGGDADAWRAGNLSPYFPNLDITYRSQWYNLHGSLPIVFGFGIHGQYLFVDHDSGIVIAKFSSGPEPLNTEQISLTVRTAVDLIDYLNSA